MNDAGLSEALTFDDVLLVPQRSGVLPADVDVATRFTRNITLAVPIVSAAMDTVTEAPLAIAIAQEGGIGVVHKNMTIAAQAAEVDKVKRSESGMIVDPVTLGPDDLVGAAEDLMAKFRISGVPIVEGDQRLVGILTNRDLRFEDDPNRPIREVMTSEGLVTAPQGTTLEEAQTILGRHRIEKLPVVDDEGRITGLSKIARLVDAYAKRPQVQERLTSQVADEIERTLDPKGVLVVIEAEHLCMSMRGVRKPGSSTVTSAVRGLFRQNAATRYEAMRFIPGYGP